MLGAVATGLAIGLTYIIARRQGEESSKLAVVVARVNQAVGEINQAVGETQVTVGRVKDLLEGVEPTIRRMAERDSAEDYDPDASDDEPTEARQKPTYEAEAIHLLRVKGADLDFDNLEWKPKMADPPLPGNHGWFVESPNKSARWFVRRARGMTVRKAMPRDFLRKLEQDKGIPPQSIALDFQLKQHGLAAWYARTYSGDLYKVAKSNSVPGTPIRAEKVVEENG
jgi:hypothetical protein